MTEAQIIEQINAKRNELEEIRSKDENSDAVKSIEAEIDELVKSLSTATTDNKSKDQQVFLDECAG